MSQPVLHDFRCDRGHEFEAFTAWSEALGGLLPVLCSCHAETSVVYKRSAAIRTADNIPKDTRLRTTGGALRGGAMMAPIRDENGRVIGKQLVEPQTGLPIAEAEAFARNSEKFMSADEFERKYLHDPMADAPPEGEFCDDPKNLKAVLDDCDEVWDKSAAGELPPFERPMTETFERETGKSAADVTTGGLSNADDVS